MKDHAKVMGAITVSVLRSINQFVVMMEKPMRIFVRWSAKVRLRNMMESVTNVINAKIKSPINNVELMVRPIETLVRENV